MEIDLRAQRDGQLLQLEARARIFEIETLCQLAGCLVDRIRDLVGVELRDDIERWHGTAPYGRSCTEASAAEASSCLRFLRVSSMNRGMGPTSS